MKCSYFHYRLWHFIHLWAARWGHHQKMLDCCTTVGLVVCTANEQPVGLGSIFNNCKLHLRTRFKHKSQWHMLWSHFLNTSITFLKYLRNRSIIIFILNHCGGLSKEGAVAPLHLSHMKKKKIEVTLNNFSKTWKFEQTNTVLCITCIQV